jgi:AcrR family transcriptional regulator
MVRELHTSKSTIYKYFKTKEDLVRGLIEHLDEEINAKLEEIIQDPKTSIDKKLSLIIGYTKTLLSSISEAFLYDLKYYTPDIWDYYERLRETRIQKYYRQLFRSGIEQKLVRDDISVDILLSIYLQLNEISFNPEQFNKLNYTKQQLYEEITRVFLEGILVRSSIEQ